MDLVDEQVISADCGFSVKFIVQADAETGDGEEKQQAGIGEADAGDGIERPQEKSRSGADGDGEWDEEDQPAEGGRELERK